MLDKKTFKIAHGRTNKEMFESAHRMTKESVARFGGDYRVTFAASLRIVNEEENAKMAALNEKLKAARARRRQAQDELHALVVENPSADRKAARKRIVACQWACYEISQNVNDLPGYATA